MGRDRSGSSTEGNRGTVDRENGDADPLGRAMLAYERGEPGRLVYRDGADVRDGNVADYYFSPPASWSAETIDRLERLGDREPVLDAGCGAGRHLRWWRDRGVEAVGVDASPNAVRTARERGLERALVGDMFDLPASTGDFGAIQAIGTQLGLGGSLAGTRALLAEFARVTREDGLAVVDEYDPTRLDRTFLGYRSDPREGIAHRCFHFEFLREGEGGERRREVGRTLHFLLCSPRRLREATIGTPWRVTEIRRSDGEAYYRAILRKRE